MENIEFTILMPCLNEEKSIGFCIGEAKDFIHKNALSAEILIADNGSSDASVEIAEGLGARVIHTHPKGYGNALRGGIKAAKGQFVIMADCDGSYDFSNLDPFIELLRRGHALVVGNRFLGHIEKDAMPLSHRYFGVPFLSFLGKKIYKVSIGDFHSGLRGFDRKKALSLNFLAGGMEFATEIIAKFAKSGEEIVEVPIRLRRDLRQGKSHLRTFRDGFRHLYYMLRYRF